MLYFLDFDRTLFDSDAYNEYLLKHPAVAPLVDTYGEEFALERDPTKVPGTRRIAFWDEVSKLIDEGVLSYAPGELAMFVYPDVPEVLRSLGNEAVIITYGKKNRQKAKIESALSGVVRLTVLYTDDMLKGEYLAAYPHLVPLEACFVDDVADHLEGIEKNFPHMRLFEMRRDGGDGTGRWPVIRSLTELP